MPIISRSPKPKGSTMLNCYKECYKKISKTDAVDCRLFEDTDNGTVCTETDLVQFASVNVTHQLNFEDICSNV